MKKPYGDAIETSLNVLPLQFAQASRITPRKVTKPPYAI